MPHQLPTQLPERGRRARAALALATSVALAAVGLVLSGPAAHHAYAAGRSGLTPFTAGAGTQSGASVAGLSEYEAEGAQATTNGKLIGPDYTQGDLATEASGREAVQLQGQGSHLTFTLASAANALDLHYSLPQGASGTLSVYVNGSKINQKLSLTSQYSYISTGNIAGSRTHKLYDDARLLLPSTAAAGSTVTFQVDSGDNAGTYTLDVADFFDVAGPTSQPQGSVSVTGQGADPSGQGDSTNAFRAAIAAAGSGGTVWIPPGSYRITSALQANNVSIVGAGSWYSQLLTNEFVNNTSAVSGKVNLSNFAVLGSTVGRHDDSTANAINGSLGNGATVNGLWIQDTNVGFWLQYGNSGITVENSIVLSTDADGLNFNGNATGNTVKNNFFRNTGDDGIALWSYPASDSGNTITGNTVVQPTLANGIADYGGANNSITNNVVSDTNALGSGIALSNQAFLQPFTPLSGTVTVSGNTVIRAGAINPNWGHPMGAIRFDSYDSAITAAVDVSGNTVEDSPYSAFEIVSGGGTGNGVNGLNFSNDTVNWTGTTVFQAETTGSASVSNLTASNVGVAGSYNYGYPNNTAGTFALDQGGGNSGWSATPNLTAFPNPVGLPPSSGNGGGGTTPSPPPADPDLALNKATSDTGHTQTYVSSHAVDGDADSYWESTDGAFPQSLTVDLGSAHKVGRLVLKLPPSSAWATRTETLSVLGSTDNGSYTTLVGSKGYTFDSGSGNTATVTLPSGTSTRYVRLTFTGNTGWPAGQLSEVEAYGS